jgi:serine protease Do
MMKRWTTEDFDRYLLGQMDGEETAAFERAEKEDMALAAKLQEHRHFVGMIGKAYTRKELRRHLKQVHKAAFGEEGMHGKKSPAFGGRFVRFTAQMGVAAAVAALITFSVLYYVIGPGFGRSEAYLELRNEVQHIHNAQEYLKRELIRSKQTPVLFTGTSFAVTSDGLLATNYHVIRGLDSVWVSNFTDSLVRYIATIVYANPETDIALLKIIDPQFTGFGAIPYGKASQPADMGEYVYTLGYSKQDVVFGEGSISSVSGYRSDTTSYQVSVPVNPGNSGGPLFDSRGNLLGMISGKNIRKDGVGFAIKADYLYEAISELTDSDPEFRPQLTFPEQNQQPETNRAAESNSTPHL